MEKKDRKVIAVISPAREDAQAAAANRLLDANSENYDPRQEQLKETYHGKGQRYAVRLEPRPITPAKNPTEKPEKSKAVIIDFQTREKR